MAKRILKALNALVDFAVIFALLLAGAYSVYALWDNGRIYTAAENVREEMLKLKPGQANGCSFDELRKINPDICAWLTLDNTQIDYPILQGDDNIAYLNTDVYGEFALAGSIFLDYRNDRSFRDGYSLLYGHHMDRNKMFGDLDLYKDESFFSVNRSGTLMTNGRAYRIDVFACVVTTASDEMFFEPQDTVIGQMLDHVLKNALCVDRETAEKVRSSDGRMQILAMSTCSSDYTDARTVVLAAMEPQL